MFDKFFGRKPPQPVNIPEVKIGVDMSAFRKEIAALKAAKTENSASVEGLAELLKVDNIDELTEDDARMWNRFKDFKSNPISPREYVKYRQEVIASRSVSRGSFQALFGNKINTLGLWSEAEIDEFQRLLKEIREAR